MSVETVSGEGIFSFDDARRRREAIPTPARVLAPIGTEVWSQGFLAIEADDDGAEIRATLASDARGTRRRHLYVVA